MKLFLWETSSTRDKDYIDGDSFMSDILPASYVFDSVAICKYVTNVLMYADDLVLMSASKEGLQKCLDDLNIYCKKWKLKVNTDKTKILIFIKSGRLIKKHHFVFESEALEIVKEFKYLGIIIKASGIFTKGISELSNKALKVLFMIRKKIQSSFISQHFSADYSMQTNIIILFRDLESIQPEFCENSIKGK